MCIYDVMTYHLKIDIDTHGERWAMLVDGDGMPLFYPTLFNTAKLRGARKSTSTQEQFLTAIKVLHQYCDQHRIDLVSRIKNNEFLTTGEMDGISDACRKKKRGVRHSKVVSLKRGYSPPGLQVETRTHNIYLQRIAAYLKWLCETLLGSKVYAADTARAVAALETAIRARGTTAASKAGDDGTTRGLTKSQYVRLREIITPGSRLNPWSEESIQIRNFLIIRMLIVTGDRRGELLNARVTDIDWDTGRLKIIRRADSKEDTRRRQAKVKTRQREIPLTPETLSAIRHYVVSIRKHIPNANTHRYLFVTHKSGPTQGQMLSLQSVTDLFVTIRQVDPSLDISSHDLRHFWHRNFSEGVRSQPDISHEEAESWRRILAGWEPHSTMGQRYNKADIQQQAYKAQLRLAEQRERELAEMKKALKTHG